MITPFKVKSYLLVSLSSLALGLTIIIILTLFTSAVWTTVAANAQIFPFTHTNSTSTTATVAPRHLSTLQQQQQKQQPQPPQQQQQGQPNLHLVKITSPIKGQTVPVGKDLRISGTSTANTTTSNCSVSVIVNGIGRYHDASPNGTSSHNDYSKWNFTLTPSYTAVKQGQNKITSKFSCIKDPTAISHYSVNVTGVSAGSNPTGANPVTSNSTSPVSSKATIPVSSNSTHPVSSNSTHPVSSKATIPVSSKPTSASSLTGKNNNQVLSVSLRLDKNSLHPGDKQTITISVRDKNSSNPIAGASVIGKITSPVGPFKKVGGITDERGKASYSWTVSYVDTTGKYKLTTEVSSPGYQKYSTSKTFKVTPVAATIPYDNYITSTPADNANNPPPPPPTIIPSTPADNTNTNANANANNNNNNNNNHHNHRSHPSNTIPSNSVLSPPETNAKINFDNSQQSTAVPNPDNANVHSSKDLQSHQLITIPSISGVTISNSASTPSTNSSVTIPNNIYNNNNIPPSPTNPSINIPPTNSPVTIPNNIYNNNIPPSLTAPSTSVIPKTGDKTPFLLPFH
ncbi:MAG TPA: hypothetical protein VEL70_07925 [Candidatus Acidoferrum sp.]|nr:hypothetical protein [Candidatus Acidoferrum sp.]